MFEKPKTIGQLLGNNPTIKLEEQPRRRGRKPKNLINNIQVYADDFTCHGESETQVKQQEKYENDFLKLEEDSNKGPTKVQSFVTWTEKDRVRGNRTHKIEITNFQKKKEAKEIPGYVEQSKLDIWNSQKRLLTQGYGQHLAIPDLTEIPPEKHVLNKPQPFDNSDPRKKKMYRPPIPRIFYNGYDQFLKRRIEGEKSDYQTDLSVLTLDEVLDECKDKNLIPLSLHSIFMSLNGTYHIKTFLQTWIAGSVHQFDFKTTFFTLVDHRRLSELLLHFFPKQYTLGTIESLHLDVKQFLTKLYLLNAEDYVKVYLTMDSLTQNPWWKQLKERYKNTAYESYFSVKEQLRQPNILVDNYHSAEEKSQFVKEKLGPLKLQNNQAQLQKILSTKYAKGSQRVFPREENSHQIICEDNLSEDLASNLNEGDDSSERNQDLSRPKTSKDKSAKSSGGPDWDQLFGFSKGNKGVYYDYD